MRVHVKPQFQPVFEKSLEEVNEMISKGLLIGEELAWTSGVDKWVPLKELPGVKCASNAAGKPVKSTAVHHNGLILIGLLVTAAIVLIFSVAGRILGGQALREVNSRRENARFTKDEGWRTVEVLGLSLSSPLILIPEENISSRLPPEASALVESIELFQSEDTNSNLHISIGRFVYRPEVVTSIDGAVEGSVNAMAQKAGIDAPKFTSTPITVDGVEARSVTFALTDRGHIMDIMGVYISKDRSLWQIVVIIEDRALSEVGRKILKSVSIVEDAKSAGG